MRICKAHVINLQKVYLREDSFSARARGGWGDGGWEEEEGGWALISAFIALSIRLDSAINVY